MRSFFGAWLVSLRRTRADWPIVATASLIALLAATLLAAGPIYSAAVSEAGLHRLIASAPTTDANIEVTVRTSPDKAVAAIDAVDGLLRQTVDQQDLSIVTGVESDTFALPGQDPGNVRDLVVLGSLDGIQDHATLVDGAWPVTGAGDQPVQVAVLEAVAATLGLHVGDRLRLTSRISADTSVDVAVSAIYTPTDARAPFWWDDSTLLQGVTESTNYRTFGPVWTPRDELLGRVGGTSVHISWHAFPAVDQLRIADIGGLRSRTELLSIRINDILPGTYPTVKTGLPALMASSEQSLLVSRTGVLLLLVQLGVLAGYAIALTADLIVDHRRLDTALLRLRGASTRQVAVLALAESLLLAVPGIVVGPWLAALALRAFNVAGPLAGIGLAIDPIVSPDAYVAAAAAAIACALLIIVPAIGAARSFAAERADSRRPGTRTLGQRIALDLALLAVTAVALWQLRLYGTPITRTVQGALGIDPLLVAAPAIGILAGSVVALRLVPLLAHVAERLTARGRDLVGSLGTRQLARRPLRYTRTALLIMLAISMGVFSVSYASTWVGSQRDQADYQVGADARVTLHRSPDGLPQWAEHRAVASVGGVDGAMAIARDTASFTRSSGSGQLLAIDAGAAGRVLGSTVGSANVDAVTSALVEARPATNGLPLPGSPKRLRLTVTADLQSLLWDFNPETGEETQRPVSPASLPGQFWMAPTATIRDAGGLFQRFHGERVEMVTGSQLLVVPFAPEAAGAVAAIEALAGGIDGPIELAGIDLGIEAPFGSQSTGRFVIEDVASSATSDGDDWTSVEPGSAGDWAVYQSAGSNFNPPPIVSLPGGSPGADPSRLVVLLDELWGSGQNAQLVSVLRSGIVNAAAADLPVVGNRTFLAAVAAEPGDTVVVQAANGTRRLRVVGAIDSFPTTNPDQPIALVDLASLSLLRFAGSHSYQDVDEWWLHLTDPTAALPTTGVLDGATVLNRMETRTRLTTEPLAVAMIGGLSLGFVVAGLFAVIGLAVSASVSARQRRSEFALLRALGLSPSQLSGWLWLENASVVVVAVVAGTALGLAIGWIVLPFVTVSAAGGAPFPPVVVDVPWPSVLILTAVSAAALVITLVVLVRSIRRAGIGSVLRMGEE
jgi:ABC-type lipoprotein release transport system permease subunit